MTESYQAQPWPRVRELVVDALTMGARSHQAHGLMEIDITEAQTRIREYSPQVPGGVSFTAFLVHCLAQAAGQHPALHAVRSGRRLVMFDDIDVNTLLEKRKPDGALVPVMYIVRGANHKTLAEINRELVTARSEDLYDERGVRTRRRISRLPRVLRAGIWWWLRRDPLRRKRTWGTTALSNAGAFAGSYPSWGLSLPFLTSTLIVGGIVERVRWIDGRPQPRNVLCVTISADHDIVDGAPGARFARTLAGLIEGAEGLDGAFLAAAAHEQVPA